MTFMGEADKGAVVRIGWVPVLVISAAQFSGYADRALTAAFAPDLQAQFALTDAQLGMLHGTAVIIPYAAGMVAASLWLRPERPFRLMALSIIAWTLAATAFALATSYTALFAARMMLGFTQAAFMPAALSILSISSHPRPPVAISAMTTGSATGRSGGLLIGGALLLMAVNLEGVALDPWRIASLVMIAPNLLLAAALIAKSGLRTPAGASPQGRLAPPLRTLARAPVVSACYFLTAAAAIVIVQAGGAWAPTILYREFGLSVADSAMAVGLIVLVAAPLGHLSAGRVAARWTTEGVWPHSLMLLGLVVTLLSALALNGAANLMVAVPALAAFCAGGGFAAAAALIGFQPMFPAEQRFAANTLFLSTVTLVGYAVGPLVTGLLSDSLGHEELRLALTLVTAGAFAAAGLAAFVGRCFLPDPEPRETSGYSGG
jgi:MFS transporter, Spinster family, sphingosine-1-phosphate transporter